MRFTVVGIDRVGILEVVTVLDDAGIWPFHDEGLVPWIWQGEATSPVDAVAQARKWHANTVPTTASSASIRLPDASAAQTVTRRWYNPRTWC